MNKEEKVLDIVRSSKVGSISCEEAAIRICLLFNVVGQSEQLPCEHNYEPDTTCGVDITCCTKCGDII